MPEHELTLGTAGHIDHGKSALVKALTGIDTDRLAEEKERGISIELGFAHLEVGGDTADGTRRLGIVDVPGHERFIRTMLAGASGIDIALLVVAADDSVMPQTREHLAILRLLKVRQGLIAITKSDLVEPDWLDLVEEDVKTLVAGSFLEGTPIIRTSAVSGVGLDELRAAVRKLCDEAPRRAAGDFFRLAIDRSFAMQGLGTVVTGTVWTGRASVGDEVEWLPVGGTLRVRGLQSHGREVESVVRGQRAAFNLMGASHREVLRGHEIATPGYLQPTQRLTATVDVLEESPWPLKHRARVRLHVGTQEVIARVWLLRDTTVERGRSQLAQLITAEPTVAVARQPLVIRSESPLRTIGGGTVLQAAARPISRRDAASIDRLETLVDGDDRARVGTVIYLAGASSPGEAALCRETDLQRERVAELVAQLDAEGETLEISSGARRSVRVHRDFYAELRDQVTTAARRLHEASPLGTSITRKRLAQELRYLDADLVAGVLARMIDDETLVGDEQSVALPEFKPKLTEAQQRLRSTVDDAWRSGGFQPPEPTDVARSAGVAEDQLRPIIELCASEGVLKHLGGKLYLHREWESELKRRLGEQLSGGRGLTVGEIRGVLDTSRKYAVPMCEYLDRIGFTRRKDDVRVLVEDVAG